LSVARLEEIAGDLAFQPIPLLAPKLRSPRLSLGLVERRTLLTRLTAGLERKVTLLCAPAGFGKTTLVSQWLPSLSGAEGGPAGAWVALDDGDNDPVRFWSYVIAACQTLYGEVGQAALLSLHRQEGVSFESRGLEASLTLLLNDVGQAPTKGVLVLEDYHVITEPQIHASLAFLLTYLPASLHLVLITRSEPPISLTLLRSRGELNELGADQLRFSLAETRAFLEQTLAFVPTPEILNRLDALVEGWPTGLRLLTLPLQGEGSEQALLERLASFANGQRHLPDYFTSEVLVKQTEDVQRFLLQTGLFDRLSASFCAAVTGREDSEQLLDRLERAHLFLLPLAGQERWYRYHPLFTEALRFEARRRLSEEDRRECFLRACLWFEQRGQLAEAIEAALLAQSFARAAELIEQITDPQRFHEMREHALLQRWLLALPASTLQGHPTLLLLLAMVQLFAADCQKEVPAAVLERVEQTLRMAEQIWQVEENRAGLGEARAFRVVLARFQGDLDRAVLLARQALAWLAESARQWRATCLCTLGEHELQTGELEAAHRTFREAHTYFKAAGNSYGQRAVLLSLAELCTQQGRLHESAALYQEVLEDASEDLSDQGHALLGLAELAYEWNRLESAEEQARAALCIGERIGDETLHLQASLVLARVECASGQTARARQQFAALLARAQTLHSPWLYQKICLLDAQLQLITGDLASAPYWPAWQTPFKTALSLAQQEQEKLLTARLLTAQGQTSEALALLTTILEAAHRQGRVHDEIEALLLTSLALSAQQRDDRVRAVLHKALALAHSEGYMRLFLDEGEPVAELLRTFPLVDEKRDLAAYARTLLLAFSSPQTKEDTRDDLTEVPSLPSIEPLSPQEQRVLSLLAAGCSNHEIARELVVSTNTVKTQVQSIYRKLNVHSRQEVRRLVRTHR
jgi:LuxR family maltose regulon positive regulatory protein